MILNCAAIGSVSLSADSCLFTPDNADYTQDIFVSTVSDFTNADCRKKIISGGHSLSFTWTYQAAQDCGWTWSQSGAELKFENSLKVCKSANKITTGGVTVQISDTTQDIPLICSFGNSFTIGSTIVDSKKSSEEHNSVTPATGGISDAFTIELKEGLRIMF